MPVILLDTHIWYWWAGGFSRLTALHQQLIDDADELGVSVISCWEIAKKSQIGKLDLDRPVEEWLPMAVALPKVRLLPLTTEIAIEACHLPGEFHRDPADELIVATARIFKLPLLTADSKIRAYPHVSLLS